MPVYFGKKYEAERQDVLELPFECKVCGFKTKALVLGRGRGTANSPFMLDNDGAADRASADAHFAMTDNAWMTLGMARCPRCQGKRAGPYLRFFVVSALKMLGLFALMVPVALLTGYCWVWGAAALVVIVYYVFDVHWKWAGVDKRVVFHEVEQRKREKRAGSR